MKRIVGVWLWLKAHRVAGVSAATLTVAVPVLAVAVPVGGATITGCRPIKSDPNWWASGDCNHDGLCQYYERCACLLYPGTFTNCAPC